MSEIGKEYPTLNELAKDAYANSKDKGFYDDLKYHSSIESLRSYEGNKMMLVAGEVAEAHEELRSGHHATETYYNDSKPEKPEGVPAELADVIIRIADYAGWKGIDLDAIVAEKMAYNSTRPKMHGRKF